MDGDSPREYSYGEEEDDDQIGGSGSRRNYSSGDDDSDSDDADGDGGGKFRYGHRGLGRGRRRLGGGDNEEALYGVFATGGGGGGSSSDEDNLRFGKRARGGRDRAADARRIKKAVARGLDFVPSSSATKAAEDGGGEPPPAAIDDEAPGASADADAVAMEPEDDEEDDDEETRRMEERNARFYALLQRGRGEGVRNNKGPRDAVAATAADSSPTPSRVPVVPLPSRLGDDGGDGVVASSGLGGSGLGMGMRGGPASGGAAAMAEADGQQQKQQRGSGGGGGLGYVAASPSAGEEGGAGGIGIGGGGGGGIGIGGGGGGGGLGLGALPSRSMMGGGGGIGASEDGGAGRGGGLGFVSGGFERGESHRPARRKPVDRDFGKWEKHTKGIGMKLLAKMGFDPGQGGLGSKKRAKATAPAAAVSGGDGGGGGSGKGVSRPVEVVVRPANLGLGYGNFQEASSLKVNKQIEAEMLGKDPSTVLVDSEATRRKKGAATLKNRQGASSTSSSALPSTESLLRDRARGGRKRKRQQQRRFVSVDDLTKGGSSEATPAIIDMRGPQAAVATSESGEVLLGTELLYNVTQLLGTTEANIHSCSHMISSTANKIKSVESDVNNLQSRLSRVTHQEERLRTVSSAIDDMEKYVADAISSSKAPIGGGGNDDSATMKTVFGMLADLKERVPEEYDSLKISKLSTMLISPLIRQSLRDWDPLREPDRISELLDQWRPILPTDVNAPDAITSIVATHLLPKIQRAIAGRWDVTDARPCVALFEMLSAALLVGSEDEDVAMESEAGSGTALVHELANDTIYPKLHRSVTKWRPRRDPTPVNAWVLPWLPHLDESARSSLLSDVGRRLRGAFLGTGRNAWHPSDESALNMLLPWRGVMDDHALESLVGDAITPQLATALSELVIDPSRQDLEPFRWVLRWEEAGMLPRHHFVSLVEGELMLNWSTVLYSWVSSGVADFDEVSQFYMGWKSMFPQSALQDRSICAHLYAGLLMIDAAISGDKEALDDLRPPDKRGLSYRSVLKRRIQTDRIKEASSKASLRGESAAGSTEPSAADGTIPQVVRSTFRDAVENFAAQHNILLQPRIGENALKDGKQIFSFGKTPVYFDKEVAFALIGSKWEAKSLQDLVSLNKQ